MILNSKYITTTDCMRVKNINFARRRSSILCICSCTTERMRSELRFVQVCKLLEITDRQRRHFSNYPTIG